MSEGKSAVGRGAGEQGGKHERLGRLTWVKERKEEKGKRYQERGSH